MGHGREQKSHSGSYYNIKEACTVVAFLRMLRKGARQGQQGRPESSFWCTSNKIRVITFYSAQVSMLKQLLRKERMPNVSVATVDSSQGCEADIVILSFVRTTKAGFLADDRRMNVALTRAKYKLICLGNVKDSLWATTAADESSSGTSQALKRMIDEVHKRGCISFAL